MDGVLGTGDQVLGGVPSRILPAPGHSPNQMMIVGGGVCFLADACFAPEVLQKHGIPFYVDVRRTAATLADAAESRRAGDRIRAGAWPGGGRDWAVGAHRTRRVWSKSATRSAALSEADEVGEIVRLTADHLGVNIPNPVIYWLTQTTVLACLSALQAETRVDDDLSLQTGWSGTLIDTARLSPYNVRHPHCPLIWRAQSRACQVGSIRRCDHLQSALPLPSISYGC